MQCVFVLAIVLGPWSNCDVMTNSAIWDLRPTAFWRHLCVDRAKVMYWCSCVCVKSVFFEDGHCLLHSSLTFRHLRCTCS